MRADGFVWGKEYDLEILACRERDDWYDGVTLQLGDRFFRFINTRERIQGAYHVIGYRFAELDENEVIRGATQYVATPARHS